MNRMERWIRRYKGGHNSFTVKLAVNPFVGYYLTNGLWSRLNKIRLKNKIMIKLIEDDTLGLDDFRFYSAKEDKDITEEFDK
jgi:hypothetical protein